MVGVSIALGPFGVLAWSLLPLALITSSKDYPLYPIGKPSSTLAGSP